MLFKRISRSTPEQVFVVAKNVSGSTMTAGYSCVWDVSATVDGVNVTIANTADLGCFAGVADSNIANNAYGLIQVYGYRATTYVYSSTGSSAAGEGLNTVNGEWGLTPSAASSASAKSFAFLCEAVAGSSSSRYHLNAKAFIRAL